MVKNDAGSSRNLRPGSGISTAPSKSGDGMGRVSGVPNGKVRGSGVSASADTNQKRKICVSAESGARVSY